MNCKFLWLPLALLAIACTPSDKENLREKVCIPTKSCDCVHCDGVRIK